MIQIYKVKNIYCPTTVENMIKVEWSSIESDLIPFIELNRDSIENIIITFPLNNTDQYDRIFVTPEEIINYDRNYGKLVRVTILLK